MGDRALIQLTNGKSGDDETNSPVLYLHWGGSTVGELLRKAQELMRTRPNDVDYAFARLVGIAHMDDPDNNTGIGVFNNGGALTADDSHGDAGCFLVDVSEPDWTVKCGGGYGFEEVDDGFGRAFGMKFSNLA
jgi:hypothetical protein